MDNFGKNEDKLKRFVLNLELMKKTFLLSLILLYAFSANAQTDELVLEKDVSAHREIDAIYRSFSDAYRTLDVEKVANLYAENAAYLPPDNDILQGREAIRPTFKSFFDWIKKEGRTMTISFRIFQRKADKNLAFDVGIYTIRQYKDGTQVGTGQGKFVVVAVREKDGKWRFQVDGYSNLKPSKQ
jgi:uncharacterized protein (TIGR02246 family)